MNPILWQCGAIFAAFLGGHAAAKHEGDWWILLLCALLFLYRSRITSTD